MMLFHALRVFQHRLPSQSIHLSRSHSYRSLSTMGAVGTQTVDTTDRVVALRKLMAERNIDAYIVPSEDQHFSEYPAECDKRRAFISGFNGSAGTAIVTKEKAYLFTDGRYFLQAEQQLDKNWTLMKQGLPDVPTWQEFITKNVTLPDHVGIDPELISASDAKSFTGTDISYSENLVDLIWATARPARPKNPVFGLDVRYAGQDHTSKLARLRQELEKQKARALVVTMLDEVAWLFNLRGADIDFNPVFFGYAVITTDNAFLFVDPVQVSQDVRSQLGQQVQLRPYDGFIPYLKELGTDLQAGQKVLIGDKASVAVAEALGHAYVNITRSPVADLKTIKNGTEIEGFRASHIRDGSALVRYFAWLEEQLDKGVELSESQGADQLEKFRSELPLFKGLSFQTISSTGPNAAIIHYAPDPNDCAIIQKDQIYLCDSGGQYLDGTTDVTRTLHFGTPTTEQRRAFTRVLQGHIAMDSAIFPNGTSGYIIDTWARRYLWRDGLDYRHGTGHGVGHFLNVHEGPQGIGTRIAYNGTPLKPGMTVSNEPGYYADGEYGIRIENVVIVREVQTPNNFGNKGFLGFEHVTTAPMGRNLIDESLLSSDERAWVDAYHKEVWEKVSPLLVGDERAKAWLHRECLPL
ncbi:Creatinase/aminopeptidase [Multifurca ochricompacta]|uniref:Creatinase/aminopeptidase n=1 Tax=Multifurca ochricompacta TaxID=376703 RepID=A0AAD4LYT7_9AGAM|nr:Creatinase/aminopeptidase [Multifurca ochricompacta]